MRWFFFISGFLEMNLSGLFEFPLPAAKEIASYSDCLASTPARGFCFLIRFLFCFGLVWFASGRRFWKATRYSNFNQP
jgi:hypothetical protein